MGRLPGSVRQEAPDAEVSDRLGFSETGTDGGYIYTEVKAPGTDHLLSSFGGSLGASVVVSDDTLPAALVGVASEDVARAEQALRDGGAVAFYSGADAPEATTAKIVQTVSDADGRGGRQKRRRGAGGVREVDG